MDPQAAPLTKQMRQLGMKSQFLGGDGAQTPKYIELAGSSAEGAMASMPGVPLESMPGGAAFKQKFVAKYGPIQNYAPYAYDAVYVLVEAMKRAGSAEPAKYLPELAKTDFQGVTSKVQFDAKGDLAGGGVTLYQVKNGTWAVLETVQRQ